MLKTSSRIVAIVTILAINNVHSTTAAEHDTYYNCSRVPFCKRLRTAVPSAEELYLADLDNVQVVGGLTIVPLTNQLGQNLSLQITALVGGQFHLIIEETNSYRYKLEYSLVEAPRAVQKIQLHKQNDGYKILRLEEDIGSSISIVTSNYGFTIEFYYNNILQSSIDSSRIIFETDVKDSQAFSFAVKFYLSDFLLGLPEHAQGVPLLHTADGSQDPYRLKNADSWRYEINSTMSMYGAIPVIYSHGKNTSGVFFHNAAQQWIDIDTQNSTAYFMSEGGTLDLFILPGPTIQDTVKQYTNLTGTAHFAPQWSLGFQQSRFGYYSQDDVKYVINNFDGGNFTLDVLWLDYNWTNAGRYFEWEPTNYSDPIGMMNFMEEKSYRKLVILNDPHVTIDPNYDFYAEALESELFVNVSSGDAPWINQCWPGNASWLDFLNPAARDLYSSYYSQAHLNGTTTLGGIWNDMNEPATFDVTIEKSLPPDLVHHNGVKHRDVHNIYGLTHTMATYAGLVDRQEGRVRPFILSRSFFAGSQRYAATWTGDNISNWLYLYVSWPMCLTLNLLGMPICGADVGGFEGSPDDELYIRWNQDAIWLPFMRTHSNITSARREPYMWSKDTQDNLRNTIQFRYKHLPVWYTEFYNHHITGEPIIRPLFYNYPQDKDTFNINDEIMLGDNILVRSIYEPNTTEVNVYFPGTDEYWYQIANETHNVFKGNTNQKIPVDISFIPVFYRAGSIIPRKETARLSSTLMQQDPFTLHIMLNTNNTAEGVLYVDDYETFEYEDENKHNYVKFRYDGSTQILTVSDLHPHQDSAGLDINIVTAMVHWINGTTRDMYDVTVLEQTSEKVPLIEVDFRLTKTVIL